MFQIIEDLILVRYRMSVQNSVITFKWIFYADLDKLSILIIVSGIYFDNQFYFSLVSMIILKYCCRLVLWESNSGYYPILKYEPGSNIILCHCDAIIGGGVF